MRSYQVDFTFPVTRYRKSHSVSLPCIQEMDSYRTVDPTLMKMVAKKYRKYIENKM